MCVYSRASFMKSPPTRTDSKLVIYGLSGLASPQTDSEKMSPLHTPSHSIASPTNLSETPQIIASLSDNRTGAGDAGQEGMERDGLERTSKNSTISLQVIQEDSGSGFGTGSSESGTRQYKDMVSVECGTTSNEVNNNSEQLFPVSGLSSVQDVRRENVKRNMYSTNSRTERTSREKDQWHGPMNGSVTDVEHKSVSVILQQQQQQQPGLFAGYMPSGDPRVSPNPPPLPPRTFSEVDISKENREAYHLSTTGHSSPTSTRDTLSSPPPPQSSGGSFRDRTSPPHDRSRTHRSTPQLCSSSTKYHHHHNHHSSHTHHPSHSHHPPHHHQSKRHSLPTPHYQQPPGKNHPPNSRSPRHNHSQPSSYNRPSIPLQHHHNQHHPHITNGTSSSYSSHHSSLWPHQEHAPYHSPSKQQQQHSTPSYGYMHGNERDSDQQSQNHWKDSHGRSFTGTPNQSSYDHSYEADVSTGGSPTNAFYHSTRSSSQSNTTLESRPDLHYSHHAYNRRYSHGDSHPEEEGIISPGRNSYQMKTRSPASAGADQSKTFQYPSSYSSSHHYQALRKGQSSKTNGVWQEDDEYPEPVTSSSLPLHTSPEYSLYEEDEREEVEGERESRTTSSTSRPRRGSVQETASTHEGGYVSRHKRLRHSTITSLTSLSQYSDIAGVSSFFVCCFSKFPSPFFTNVRLWFHNE